MNPEDMHIKANHLFDEGKYKESVLMYDEAISKGAFLDISSRGKIKRIAEIYSNVEVELPDDETLIKLADLVREYIFGNEGIQLARHIYSHVSGELSEDVEGWIVYVEGVDY